MKTALLRIPLLLVMLALLISCAPRQTMPGVAQLKPIFPTVRTTNQVAPAENEPLDFDLRSIQGPDGTLGYIAQQELKACSKTFTIRVITDQHLKIMLAEVIEYNDVRGQQVAYLEFTSQFQGKGPDDPIAMGQDIHAISGATISCRSMTAAVNRIIKQLKDAITTR